MNISERRSSIARTVTLLRRGLSLSQQDLADRINAICEDASISADTVSAWERSVSKIPAELLSCIAQALGCTADRLLGIVPEDAPKSAGTIVEALLRLPVEAQKILHWAATECTVPLPLAIQYMGAYLSLPEQYRVDPAGMMLQRFDEAKAAGRLIPGAPSADIEAIDHAWHKIAVKHP